MLNILKVSNMEKFFSGKFDKKDYYKFVNSEYTLKVNEMSNNSKRYFFSFNDKSGELAYMIKDCKNYFDVVKQAKAFLTNLKQKYNF